MSPMPSPSLRLYDYGESGNGYKVRLLLTQLGLPFERVELDILQGQTRTPEFLEKNPNHRIPLLEWPDGRRLAESDAILFHLAQGSKLLSDDPWERAETLQWSFSGVDGVRKGVHEALAPHTLRNRYGPHMGRVIVGILAFCIFVGALVMALAREANVECEVCIEFAGQRVCRTNLGADRNAAVQGATMAACSMLSSGVTRGIQCSNTQPRSVQCNE